MKMKCNRLLKKIVAVLLLLSLILQACSCSGTKLSATDELTICVDAIFYPMLKSLLRYYTETYPNVKITYEIVTRDNSIFGPLIDEDYRYTTQRRLQTEIMSGNGPDLFILDAGYTGECFFQDIHKVMRNGVFCDLLPLFRNAGILEEDFIQPVFDAGKVDGKQYVAPLEYQVYTILTTEDSHRNMGANQINDTAGMLAGVQAAMEITGTGAHRPTYETDAFDFLLNPYYYAAKPLIDYDTNTAQIDTPLTRDILETGKFAIDKMKQYELVSQPDKSWSGLTEYVHSNQYLAFCPYFLVTVLAAVTTGMCGRSLNLDPIPSEDGGVCAVISSFAGIRANSENKQNAVNMIKLLLSEQYQIRKNGYGSAYPCEGYPVRKGVLEQRLYDLVPAGKTFGSTFFGTFGWSISDESVQRFLKLESQITTARFPTPHEVNEILAQYYTGEIDLDAAIKRMQEYWEISLSE